MTWSKRSTRVALGGYVLVALLVFGSLAWTTIVSLRSERAERLTRSKNHYRRDVNLSLRRMDSRVQSTLTRESGRSPYDYASVFYPPRLWDSFGAPVLSGQCCAVSPLLDELLEDWLLLHFQVSPDQEWTSPQVPSDALVALDGVELPAKALTDQRLELLAAVKRSLTPTQLRQSLAQAYARDAANAPWWTPDGDIPVLAAIDDDSDSVASRWHRHEPLPPDARSAKKSSREYQRRKLLAQKALLDSRAAETCASPDNTMVNLNQFNFSAADSRDEERAGDVCVTPSPMTAVWLDLADYEGKFLSFVRTVPVEGENLVVYQGFLANWTALRALLLEEIADLFPAADLLPVESGPVDDLDSLMTWLPAQLVTSMPEVPAALAGWSPMRTGLLLAWAAAGTLLAAVGLGVRSLLALTERRTQFAYAVSHELRTPLTTFRLYTDMLVNKLVPEESRDEYLKTLNDESQRLSELVDGVLEYSRLEHHSTTLALADTTVGKLLDTARERFEPLCRKSDLRLVVDADGVGQLPCRTDPDLTLQIIGILIDNACKYARDAEDQRIILSAADGHTGKLSIQVRDFGPGVPRQERRRIFRPFRRGPDSGNSSGIGLGLALAERWANLLGGTVNLVADRKDAPGACFQLLLPPTREG